MVLLPEEAELNLSELRQMAARQQQQIEAQQQLLVAKEQRLKFLKQQEARHHHLAEDAARLHTLQDKVDNQELKLRQLRGLRGQVEQQKTNNGNLGAELDSIRALFSEKEKELNLAVSKVDELSRQLDEMRSNHVNNYVIELDNLRRELVYRTKLAEQQSEYICQQRESITLRQRDIALLDHKIGELTRRLHRKRLLNDQGAETGMQRWPSKGDPKYQTLPYNTKFTLKEEAEEERPVSIVKPSHFVPPEAPQENKSRPSADVKTLKVKPVVPPKPSLPVKPLNRTPPKDVIHEALSVLQNNEKTSSSNYRDRLLYYQCVPRYPRDTSRERSSEKSKVVTYFPRSADSPLDKENTPDPKRSLPIKPKPLTIRKSLGLEPPKLKVQPIARKPPPELKPPSFNGEEEDENEDVVEEEKEAEKVKEDSESPDSVKTPVVSEPVSEEGCAALRRLKKGNLKGEGSLRTLRRVSFDPLALLLDAALEGELELVKKTAAEVPNPSAANDEGITALHNAICAGHFEVVTFLVDFGCDVNAQDSDGWTPLHCAASCNNLPMVKFLVERGACIFATTLSDHETAAEKCEEDEEGFDTCSEYLYSLQEKLGVVRGGSVFAVYDYEGQNLDELSFRDGDALSVLRKGDDRESEWWWSRSTDKEGYVPRNLLGLYPRVPFQSK